MAAAMFMGKPSGDSSEDVAKALGAAGAGTEGQRWPQTSSSLSLDAGLGAAAKPPWLRGDDGLELMANRCLPPRALLSWLLAVAPPSAIFRQCSAVSKQQDASPAQSPLHEPLMLSSSSALLSAGCCGMALSSGMRKTAAEPA